MPDLVTTVRQIDPAVATPNSGEPRDFDVSWRGDAGVLCEVADTIYTVRVMDPVGEDVSVAVALRYIEARAAGATSKQSWQFANHAGRSADGDARPPEVDAWVADEAAKIAAAYGESVEIGVGDRTEVLLTVTDPAGQGWTGSARLDEVRVEGTVLEFTVFFTATPPSKRRPVVHLWGLDVRYEGQRAGVSMGAPWQHLEIGDAPALQGGIDRLV